MLKTRNQKHRLLRDTAIPAERTSHYHKRINLKFPICIRSSENQINNTCTENRKIRRLKLRTLLWRHRAVQRKTLNMCAQLQNIQYIKPPKYFVKCTA